MDTLGQLFLSPKVVVSSIAMSALLSHSLLGLHAALPLPTLFWLHLHPSRVPEWAPL